MHTGLGGGGGGGVLTSDVEHDGVTDSPLYEHITIHAYRVGGGGGEGVLTSDVEHDGVTDSPLYEHVRGLARVDVPVHVRCRVLYGQVTKC